MKLTSIVPRRRGAVASPSPGEASTPHKPSHPGTRQAEGHRRLTYRPAVDGLRAIAVIAVIVAHVDESILPAGWLGVDVFFVISGFLITTLLLRERARDGRIDLVGFWLARARRLLPALVLVLAAVLIAARTIGLPARLDAVRGDVISTFFYTANWRMLLSDEAYFAGLAAPSPLRHAWSLSVEEQYYLVYPLLLLALLRLARSRLQLAGALGALVVLSAGLMALLHTPGTEPTRVYYGTDTRAFELFVGAVLAVLVLRGRGRPSLSTRRTEAIARAAAPACLVAVLATFALAGSAIDVLFRGGMLIFCLLCGIVVVAAVSPEPSLVQRVLAWEPLRRVGLISYGLYLWHWPVIVYLNQLMPTADALVRAYCQIALSVVLATLSYVLVERPIRAHGVKVLLPRFPKVAGAAAASACVLLVAGAWALPAGVDPGAGTGTVANDLKVVPEPYVSGDTQRRALLIGNSIPAAYSLYYPRGTYPDLTVADHTNPGCDMFPDRRYNGDTLEPTSKDCTAWRAGWTDAIEAQKPDLVVLFVSQSLVADRQVDGRRLDFESPAYDGYVARRMDEVAEHVKAAGNPRLALVNLTCYRVPLFGDDEMLTRVNDDRATARVNAAISRWADDSKVPVIDLRSFLCGDGYHDAINGVPLYSDYFHVTKESAPQVWSWLAPRVRDLTDRETETSR